MVRPSTMAPGSAPCTHPARLLLLWLVSAALLVGCAAPAPELEDLQTVEDLKTRFNQDQGKPRIVLLLSPT